MSEATATAPPPAAAPAPPPPNGGGNAPPPKPADAPVAFTQEQIDIAFKAVRAQQAFNDLRTSSTTQCDQINLTLQVGLQWTKEDDAADHLTEITAALNGAIEQVARLRSTMGSTQTP